MLNIDTTGNDVECDIELNRDFKGACLNEALQFSREAISPKLQDTAMNQDIAMDAGTASRILIQATDIIQTIAPLLTENNSAPQGLHAPETMELA